MPGHRRRFARHAFHQVAVRTDDVDVIVEQREAVAVEGLGQPARGDRHAHGIAAALTEGTGGGLDAGRHPVLGMSRRLGTELTEPPDVVETHRRLAGRLSSASISITSARCSSAYSSIDA